MEVFLVGIADYIENPLNSMSSVENKNRLQIILKAVNVPSAGIEPAQFPIGV